MTLGEAILNTLATSSRALPLDAVTRGASDFTNKDESQSDVLRELKKLERNDPPLVAGTSSQFKGIVWKATDDGRLLV